mgnify:CR=1 FL=1
MTILDNMIEVLIQTSTTYTQDVEGTVMVNAAEWACLQDMTITGELILAPGVKGNVTLTDTSVSGSIRNYGTGQVVMEEAKSDPTPKPEPSPEVTPEPSPDATHVPETAAPENLPG